MLNTAVMLALWIDVEPEVRDECDRWYVEKHIAERMRVPGWRRARRFRAAAGTAPATLALYDVATDAQLVSDDYLALQRNVDAHDRRMRAAFRNVVRSTFRVVRSAGPGDGGVLVSLRFSPRGGADDRTRAWLIDTLLPQLEAATGVVAVHFLINDPSLRARHDVHRRSGDADADADWLLLVETTAEDRAEAVCKRLADTDARAAIEVEPGAIGTYLLMYAALQAEPPAIGAAP